MNQPADDPNELRPHTYDGIQEFDKRMPNWWLFTLYGSIVFSFFYWLTYHAGESGPSPGLALEEKMKENAKLAARNATELTDAALWEMSRDPQVVAAGKTTFLTSCVACHLPDLSGQIGPNLRDTAWVHSEKPTELVKLVIDGVPAKGMPTWGPILGRQKSVESVAYILSYHKEGEPVTIAPWVPVVAPAATP